MLSEKPTFSVVIPLYNKERYIARAIRSVLSQSMGDFELLVVDDGSTDGGAAVVETIRDARIRLVKQQNGGECAARNRGITEAHASSIAFLDADDEWLPGHLETIERLAERLPDCGAYATTTVTQDSQGKIQVKVHDGIPAPPWEGVMQNYFRSATSYPVSSSAVAIPKRVFDSVGLFRVGVQVGGDVDMWCRIALRYPIAFSTAFSA